MTAQSLTQIFPAVVAEANRAPSVHNIQPTRWRLDTERRQIELSLDPARRLPAADPSGRDLLISCGAAAEGTVIALSRHGMGVSAIENMPDNRFVLTVTDGATPDQHLPCVDMRRTWRGLFSPAVDVSLDALKNAYAQNVVFIEDTAGLAQVADLNDSASLDFFKNKSFLSEMRAWMRFSPRHKNWSRDGMNAPSMAMSWWEARIAAQLLRPQVFAVIERMGLARAVISDEAKIKSAAATVLFCRPKSESLFDKGRALYRFWLDITAQGLHACPMAALSDTPQAESVLRRTYNISPDLDMVMALRIGRVDNAPHVSRSRLPIHETILKDAE